MEGPIASAVMLPENDVESPRTVGSPPGGHKRRPSSTSEQDHKRQRLNSIGEQSPVQLDRKPLEPSKPQNVLNGTGRRERGRERRLFGAALGALSQNSATAAQKRRSEIAERQKAQRVLEEQETDQRKAELAAQRKAQRLKEQERFEKDSVYDLNQESRLQANLICIDSPTTQQSPPDGPLPPD